MSKEEVGGDEAGEVGRGARVVKIPLPGSLCRFHEQTHPRPLGQQPACVMCHQGEN